MKNIFRYKRMLRSTIITYPVLNPSHVETPLKLLVVLIIIHVTIFSSI